MRPGSTRKEPGRRGAVGRTVFLCGALAVAASAQDPTPTPTQEPTPAPQEPKPQKPEPQQPAPRPEPSAAERAAEALRKALGLKPGPVADDPNAQGPAATPPREPPATAPPAPTQPQEPAPNQPGATAPDPNVDAAEQAARALQNLLPQAVRPQEPTPPPPAEGAAPVPAAPRSSVRGSVAARYRLRRTGEDADQDLSVSTTLDFGVQDRDRITGRFSGRGFWDLDGIQRDNAWNGLDESFDDRVNGYVYEAYVDWRDLGPLERARLGRQPLLDTPVALDFDGVHLESQRHGDLKAVVSAHAGVPVRYWEASRAGDSTFGAALRLQPVPTAAVRLDWMHIEDETFTFDGSDDLLSASWRQAIGASSTLLGKHTWLDGKPRDLVLRGFGHAASLGLDVNLAYKELLTAQQQQSTDLDPYFPVLQAYEPYRQLEASLSQQASRDVAITAGCDLRRLRDPGDEGQWNREYTRVYAGPSLQRLFGEDLTLSVQGELWDASGSSYRTCSGDLRWRLSPAATATLGSSYARFGYDSFSGIERDFVRSHYLRLQYRPRPSLRLDGTMAFEDNDEDRYFQLRVGTTWTF